MVTSHIQYLGMAVISGSWKVFDKLCGQIAAYSLMHVKVEVLVGSVIYSNFQMDALDGDSLSINVSLVSFPAHTYD